MDIETSHTANLSQGRQISKANDQLIFINPQQLYMAISQPDAALQSLINKLRTIQAMDPKKYRELKTQLPYVVGARFKPAFRKNVNFAATDYLIMDLDHIGQNNKNIYDLKLQLAQDEQLLMMFVSPGGDGLKLLFGLDTTCYDAVRFSLIYKAFAGNFAKQYSLLHLVDMRTHDAARACFLSADADAYYNTNALPIKTASYINDADTADVQASLKLLHNDLQVQQKTVPKVAALQVDILADIRQKLLPSSRKPKIKQVFVPKELERVVSVVGKLAAQNGILLKESRPINYGHKLVFEVGNLWAELNVFYGKKGFSIVRSPKNGSDKELTELVYTMLNNLLYG